ncbi:MAG: biotin/lipoyl-binding protein, partial [Pseudomonadota bacterium]
MKDIDGFEHRAVTQDPPRRPTPILYWLGATTFAMMLVFGATAAVIALHQRPAESVENAPPPLTVQASPLTIEYSYSVTQSFIGRVEPARETQAAFELAGLVLQVAVEEGAQIEEGAVLAVLDTDALTIELARLDAEGR